MTDLVHLFSPVKIGNMDIKNRLLMSAMSINFGVDDRGYVTDQLIEYFKERAKGGVGMMLVGGGAVHPGGQELPDLPSMWDDGCIPSLKHMVDQIKPYDVKFGVQLMHGGRQSYLPEKVAPSAIPAPAVVTGEVRALEIDEIDELVNCFGDSARRCRDAGFDFIEIHAAHGYLINQFMSPNANIRTDRYGGAFENRVRFLFEIIDNIQEKAGSSFPVGIRMNGNDYYKNGWGIEDAKRLAVLLEEKQVAYLHVSAGVYGSTELTIPSMYTRHGCFVHLADAVKQVVSLPVIAVGRIKDPRMADTIIKEKKADIVAMGRGLLADPYLPQKAYQGKFSEIRPCMGCCLGCIDAVLSKEPGSCVANPDVGREFKLKELKDAEKSLSILVAGAGPAGLAAARMFALRGHRVAVCEKQKASGGLLSMAAKSPGRGELNDILDFFRKELEKNKVSIRYNTELSEDLIKETAPDKIIVATGSMPDMPVIKGLFQTQMTLATNVDILSGTIAAGTRVIVLGGGMSGLVTAAFLADTGCEVVILNRRKRFAEEMSSNDRFYLREQLNKGNTTLYKKVSIKKITPRGAVFKFGDEKEALIIDNFDTIVISEKMIPIKDIKKLSDITDADFHFIGDAKDPRHLMYCISEAEETAREH
ncbi:MAG: FAD-dependent oxidoreductase [Desulfobacteraceae bacterium]